MTEERNRGFVYRERVGRVPPGTAVLAYLRERYAHSTEAAWRERIEAGRVLLDGAPVAPEAPVREGAILEWMRPPWIEPSAPAGYEVLYRDDELLAVAKPAGLPTLPGGGYLERTLLALVRAECPEAVPAHRLGRWTSGIVLFARTPRARGQLAEDLRLGALWKRYRALASGRPERDRFTVDTPIGPVPHAVLGTVHGASARGRPALSEVHVLERREESFLADVVIATGRPHQIRIHLAAAGHPLLGDPLYPAGGVPSPSCAALPGDPGYRLHAAEVRLRHPLTGQELCLLAPPPGELVLTLGDGPESIDFHR